MERNGMESETATTATTNKRILTITLQRSKMTEWLNANETDTKPIENGVCGWMSSGMRWINSNTSVSIYPPPHHILDYFSSSTLLLLMSFVILSITPTELLLNGSAQKHIRNPHTAYKEHTHSYDESFESADLVCIFQRIIENWTKTNEEWRVRFCLC